jgi:galactose oxidase
MGVLLQGFFKMPPNVAVPSPADGDAAIDWWWDHLAKQANELRESGFTAVWLPPVLKTSDGDKPGSDGYGPFDDYDIGSKNQKGSRATRFGTREQLQRCAAVMRANGLDIYLDMVEHQRVGDTTPFVFRYLGADGTPDVGRFPKNPLNFVPNVPRDPALGGPPSDDFPFGRELAPINAKPPHYVFDNLISAGDWLTRALDVQGYRVDDVKGLSTEFLLPFLNSKSMSGKFAVGEFFDGNRILVNGWIFNPNGMKGRPSAFDFPTKFVLNAMCNNPGGFNMADLDHIGLAGISPMNVVTFVENHDTDLTNGEKIVINKILGYAYILTSEGYPCVYYRDYSTDKNCFGLKPLIDNLIWIHEKLANGATEQRWKDFNVFAYERLGAPNLLVGLNNDPNNARTITVATNFGPNVSLHDYAGHSTDVTTDGNGSVTITIPKNVNGASYVCYSRQGLGGTPFDIVPRPANQDFEGAEDLDIPAASNGTPLNVARIWSRANSPLSLTLKPDVTGWTPDTSITLDVLSPDGSVLATSVFKANTPAGTALQTNSKEQGFHTLRLTLAGAPAAKLTSAFSLSASYTAPATFVPQQAAAALDLAAQASNPAEVGQWSATISLVNVPIHTHVLPTGKVLFWGRRNPPGTPDFPSLNQHETHAFIWDPANPNVPAKPTSNQPTDSQGNTINLFCSGHTFLEDGRLLVTGGHLFDSQGLNTSTFYNPITDRWSAGPTMNHGRWYPTAVTVPDGRAFVSSGSFAAGVPQFPPIGIPPINNIPQILENGGWIDVTSFNTLPLFPRLHVAPDGSLFMSGTNAGTFLFENFRVGNPGTWVPTGNRGQNADYAPSVMYDVGKVVYIGGGSTTNVVETIDLNAANPAWAVVAPMKFRRRQHNGTLLPDGTVLVTGGSQGTGFNDLTIGDPIRAAELWDPAKGTWTQMASEAVDRCYHSTAVLLPDGRVFSGGGGEFAPNSSLPVPNDPSETHANAQIFSPPYLFKGARPIISKAPPTHVVYGESFDVETPAPNEISQVTWLRLSSVTHSFNSNQRINFLTFQRGANKVTVTAPPNGNVCPPGHYMLFLLNQNKVPSIAAIIQITAAAAGTEVAETVTAHAAAASPFKLLVQKTAPELDAEIQAREKDLPIVVGVTPTCPYGISACWGGAYEALSHMQGVRLVRPMPNADDSTAYVYLQHAGLPDLGEWAAQFAHIANGTHIFRGVEITMKDVVQAREGDTLVLQGNDIRPPLLLQPIQAADKIQWDSAKVSPQPLTALEEGAYLNLQQKVKDAGGSLKAGVTGPLKKVGDGFVLEVRKFE